MRRNGIPRNTSWKVWVTMASTEPATERARSKEAP